MATQIPVKAIYTGADVTSLGEYAATDTIASSYLSVGTTSTDVSAGDHTHTGTYEPADATIVKDADIGSTVQAYDADTAKLDVVQTFTATQTFTGITETQTAKSASFTPAFTDGTTYSCTGTMTITMPTATSGKSFTVIAATPPSWAGTIKWTGGAAPAGTGICIYTFISDGTNWYGMEAGNGFA